MTSRPIEHIVITSEMLERERGISPEQKLFRDEMIEFSALHRAVAEKMVRHGMIVFHSSAICVDGEAFLFTARSGTGKSTHARLWREVLPGLGHQVTMVNDDKPFLKFTDAGVLVCGSPWEGKHHLGGNMQVPVRAIGLICRDERNYVKPIEVQDTWLTMMCQAHIPRGDGERVKACLAMLDRLSREVPMYEIHCTMEPEAAVVAYQGLREVT